MFNRPTTGLDDDSTSPVEAVRRKKKQTVKIQNTEAIEIYLRRPKPRRDFVVE
jgi:hypothetical protein